MVAVDVLVPGVADLNCHKNVNGGLGCVPRILASWPLKLGRANLIEVGPGTVPLRQRRRQPLVVDAQPRKIPKRKSLNLSNSSP